MSKFLILCFFFAIFNATCCVDFTIFDYCKLKYPGCVEGADPDHGGHAACNCHPIEAREELTSGLTSFRKAITHLHNEYRNKIASGEEKRVPQASNMMVLTYDIELEHIARCRALNSYDKVQPPVKQETCSFTSKGESYGQNAHVYISKKKDEGSLSDERMLRSYVKSWYDEIEKVDQHSIERFPEEEASAIKHFTQLILADNTHLGCAIVWNQNVSSAEPWKLLLLCNYKGAEKMTNRVLYKQGNGCSSCPNGTKCEAKKYPFLCGKFRRVTLIDTGEPMPIIHIDGKEQRYLQNWFLILASSFFMIFVF